MVAIGSLVVGCGSVRVARLRRDGSCSWKSRLETAAYGSGGIQTANNISTNINLIYMYVEFTVTRPVGAL